MRLRRYLVGFFAIAALAVVGVLGYAFLFTSGFGPLQHGNTPWLGNQPSSSQGGNWSGDPSGKGKGSGSGDAPDAGTGGGTQTPELPSGALVLVGAIPVAGAVLLYRRRRGYAAHA
ncbi:MAG: hypothetical protein WAM30_06660 [Candidatus Dormiibacterota bacterium]